MKFDQLTSLIKENYRDEYYQNVVLKDPIKLFEYAMFLIKNKKPLPKQMVSLLAQNPTDASMLIQACLQHDQPVPEPLIQSTSQIKTSELYELCIAFLNKNLSLPESWIENIQNNSRFSRFLVMNHMDRGKPFPEKLMRGISRGWEDSEFMGGYFLKHGKPVPDILIKKVSDYSGSSLALAREFLQQNQPVPEVLLKTAIIRPEYAKFLIREYEKRKQLLPDILKKYKQQETNIIKT